MADQFKNAQNKFKFPWEKMSTTSEKVANFSLNTTIYLNTLPNRVSRHQVLA